MERKDLKKQQVRGENVNAITQRERERERERERLTAAPWAIRSRERLFSIMPSWSPLSLSLLGFYTQCKVVYASAEALTEPQDGRPMNHQKGGGRRDLNSGQGKKKRKK